MRKFLMASVATLGALAAAGAANAQATRPVAPGTILVHANGYLQFGVDNFSSSSNKVGGASAYKLNSVTTNGDARLYFGIDGVTVDNLAYGTQIELRTAKSDAGQAAGSTTNSSAGFEGVYVKRAYGYVGTKTDGYVRFGQTDSAFGLLQTGIVEQFGDFNQWPGDGTENTVLPSSSSTNSPFIYADQGAVYASDKVVLLSPSVAEPLLGGAFTAAVGFEPSSNGLKEGFANNSTAASTSNALSSTNTTNFKNTQRQDTFDAAVQYALKFNGAAIKTSVGYLQGSPIHYTGSVAGANAKYNLDTLQVLEAGAQVTYLGVTLGANVKGGQVEDAYQLKAKGGRNALGYSIGANYVVGPYIVGGSFFNEQSGGNYYKGAAYARTLEEYGLAVGANYVISKDLNLYTQYLYDHKHQPGANPSGVTGSANAQANVVTLGATFKW